MAGPDCFLLEPISQRQEKEEACLLFRGPQNSQKEGLLARAGSMRMCFAIHPHPKQKPEAEAPKEGATQSREHEPAARQP